MAATATAPDVQRILDSEAYQDFVACEVNGLSRKERADQANKTPSTVSASIKRIQEHIDKGEIEDPRTTGGVATAGPGQVTLNMRRELAERQEEGASMFIENLEKIDDEVGRIQKRIADMQDGLSDLTTKRDKIRGMAEKVGFNWDQYEADLATLEDGGKLTPEGVVPAGATS